MTDPTQFWNKEAEKYAKRPVENPEAFDKKIAITKSRMTPADVVLDLGCGTGSLALRLSPCASHIHGLDLSSEMIRIARGKVEAAQVKNITLHTGAFDDSFAVFEPESVDGICAYSLLHLVDDRVATLRRIFSLLKPGGFFVSSTVCLGESPVPFGPLLWVMRVLGKAPRAQSLTKRTLEQEMAAAGFVDRVQPDVGAKAIIAFVVATKPR